MTKAQLISAVVARLEESATTPVFYTEEDIIASLHAGYMELSDAAEWDERYLTVDLLADRPWYDGRTVLGADLLTIGAAFSDSLNRWLVPTAGLELDRADSRWERVPGPPQRVLTNGLWWFSYWPRMGSDLGTVKQYYTALPAALSESVDEPGFPETFHQGLVEFAVYDLLAQEGETQRAMVAWLEYLSYERGLQAFVEGRLTDPMLPGYASH